MKKTIIYMVIMTGLLAGCAIKPSREELAKADYGTYPTNYEESIKAYMSHMLKDPYSAQYEFINRPKPGWHGLGGSNFGYVVCTYINAKNSFGGYTGAKLNYFMIRNGQVIYHLGGGDQYSESMAQGACQDFM
jgi:hypothetical protein